MAPKVSKEHFKERQQHILACAKRVFEKKGYEPVSMQDIVNEAGISRGNLYQYFDSTEEIFRAILTDGDTNTFHYIESLEKYNSIWQALNTYLDNFLIGDNETFGIVIYEFSVTSWRNEARKAFFNQRYEQALDVFVKLLQTGVDRGEFQPIQPLETIANVMINLLDGFVLETNIAYNNKINIPGQMDGLRIYLKTVLTIS